MSHATPHLTPKKINLHQIHLLLSPPVVLLVRLHHVTYSISAGSVGAVIRTRIDIYRQNHSTSKRGAVSNGDIRFRRRVEFNQNDLNLIATEENIRKIVTQIF